MRILKYSAALCAAIAAGSFLAGPAYAQAGFDCRKASTPTERAICADREIAAADRAMTLAYSALIKRVDNSFKSAIQQDQQAFIKIRKEAFEDSSASYEVRIESLLERTEERAEYLNWVSVTDAPSLIGKWYNAWGVVEVKHAASGKLAVQFDVADQANGTWVCSFSGELNRIGAKEAGYKGDGGPLLLRLDGAVLKIPTPFCDDSTSGGFGSAAGTYFRMGE